ncbi:acyl-CoA thioesterase II [Alkalilimnicola ehrlichii]|uniref:Acyl-CoA thioesterase II n=1 Tax=Alkalilimnicola ehrlichii TaxID=351052 RepID=A0A3E0X0C1_9GAMM|nr:thioesterase family protein [Alkalilimnicola ehrlichii]RFA38874.1 acyl-CoA thioesterase II [Alkalilimnicola ehrlichii]
MSFTTLLDTLKQSADNRVVAPASWLQGRATFGGLIGGWVYEAMRKPVPAERALRSLSVSFVGPVAAEAAVTFDTEVLRQGGSVTQVQGRAMQDGGVMLAALGSFGAPRESRVGVLGASMPAVKPVEQCLEMPMVQGVTPTFAEHFAYRWAIGDWPFSGSDSREMGGWIRFREPMAGITEGHLLGLVDAWPPAVLPMLKQPAASSSLCWTIEFPQPLPAIGGDEWLLYRAAVEQAADGYAFIGAQLWTAAGRLLALSRQTVTVFG